MKQALSLLLAIFAPLALLRRALEVVLAWLEHFDWMINDPAQRPDCAARIKREMSACLLRLDAAHQWQARARAPNGGVARSRADVGFYPSPN